MPKNTHKLSHTLTPFKALMMKTLCSLAQLFFYKSIHRVRKNLEYGTELFSNARGFYKMIASRSNFVLVRKSKIEHLAEMF